jgi:hypothetical protein
VGVLPAKVQNCNSIDVFHILSVIPAEAGIFLAKDRNLRPSLDLLVRFGIELDWGVLSLV